MDEKLRSLIRWSAGIPAPPVVVDLNLTNRCNLKCRSCWLRSAGSIDHSNELSRDELLSIVRQGAQLGVHGWEITGGGEPLFNLSTAMALMSAIKKYQMYGSITTNGTLFTAESIKTLVRIGWDKVVFSLDAPDPATNDYLRGRRGAFDRCMEALDIFKYWKERLSCDKPVIQFNTVLSNRNYNKMVGMIELAHEVGCEAVHVEPLTVHSPLGEKLKLKTDDHRFKKFRAEALRAKAIAVRYGIYTNLDELVDSTAGSRFVEKSNKMTDIIRAEGICEYKKNKNLMSPTARRFINLACYEPWYHMVIKVDGSVGPCCLFIASAPEWNVRRKSLSELWNGVYFASIRKQIIDKKFPDYCAICNTGQVLENRRLRRALIEYYSKKVNKFHK
jgi:MoaA/NifB/PqqE/SkfB family radical SAM enzyme